MARMIKMITTLAGPQGVVEAGQCCMAEDNTADLLIESFQAEEVRKRAKGDRFVDVHLKDSTSKPESDDDFNDEEAG